MTQNATRRCRYQWKGDVQSNCCYRETWRDFDRCIWHAEPDNNIEKPIEELQSVREDSAHQHATRHKRGQSAVELLDGAKLNGIEFHEGISFKKCSLRDSNISQANLSDLNLRDAVLSDTNLRGTDLSNVDLKNANLSSARLYDADLSGANLSNTNLNYARIGNTNFVNTNLFGSDFLHARVSNVDFTRTRTASTQFDKAELEDVNFSEGDLRWASFSEATLKSVNLSETILWAADLSEGVLNGVNLSKADFVDPRDPDGPPDGADLSGADLIEANLSKSNLAYCDLSGANLRGATLSGADLRHTKLSNIKLNQRTEFGKSLPELRGSDSWDRLAQAYHDIKIEFAENGIDEGARRVRILERRARTKEAQAAGDRLVAVGDILHYALTGYGVRVLPVFKWTGLILLFTTVWYSVFPPSVESTNPVAPNIGIIKEAVYYSVVTFVTSPPYAPRTTGWIVGNLTFFVTLLETYVGTTLIILLGYVLSNRDRF